jgi:hypothetical protein
MPLLDNPKHEIFAQELAQGCSQEEAYETAGYQPSRQHASRLATNGYIRARVDEIMGGAAERAEVTVESLIREAGEIQRLATAAGQLSAATGALKLKAVFAGLYVEKADNTNTYRNVDPGSLSDAEIVAIIEAGRGDSPAPKPNGGSGELMAAQPIRTASAGHRLLALASGIRVRTGGRAPLSGTAPSGARLLIPVGGGRKSRRGGVGVKC